MDYIVVCDFDGTITLKDTCFELVKSYAVDDWRALDRLWQEGIHDASHISQMLLDMIKITPAELERFSRSMEIDPYFKEFKDELASAGIELYIVSDGYDLLIDPVLLQNDLAGIECFSNQIKFEPSGLKGYFPNKGRNCSKCGSCKFEIIKLLKTGRKVIYVGDGHSDRCAGLVADIIYAKGDLASLLKEQGIAFVEYSDFSDVLSHMRANILKLLIDIE
ncbi:2,3-diketo-5-methylthio-1-phosphopentane phosphatase [Peptoclostridium acidaminophilum DSM 3953]|uniref:2,3-diketo-5-methylthio-1-phosphopentane phosphatase n=1 Tax=Peptoclostridium acidaminophilum DSM 3953 TaxID=1286171 RepID=W8T1C7_PEPAC|nr:MtnX-like HAD-IB family phosphatase [Peptoclostridium acidaminophilum]AHM55534.1 2,3-diketo-5-methylthio-1-phosphopentane phosphatase [Peptoclostridium acidaminophilum DSM 3953]